MAYFPTWREWVALRESNARKRHVAATLNGQATDLPGSYAANPSTNVRAMKVAKKKGRLTGPTGRMASKLFGHFGESERMPDYSFDRWVQMAKELGDDVNKLVGHGRDEEEKIDKAKKDHKPEKPKSEPKSEPEEAPEADTEDNKDEDQKKKEEEAWKQLRQIHKDRLKDFESQGSSQKHSPKPASPSSKQSGSSSSRSS